MTDTWDWLQERDRAADFDSYSSVKLNEILKFFYALVQYGKGQPYSVRLHDTEVWNTASNFYWLLAIISQANIS